MREILFRGKSLSSGKWTQGYLFKIWEKAYICWGIVNDVPDMTEVDPKTVCQYTGLEDKNGNKIFEGDCVGHSLNVVEYLNDCFTLSGDRPLSMLAKHCAVIGNIYDNPEMLGSDCK